MDDRHHIDPLRRSVRQLVWMVAVLLALTTLLFVMVSIGGYEL